MNRASLDRESLDRVSWTGTTREKYDIKNNFRQFTKTLIISFQLNKTHADLV